MHTPNYVLFAAVTTDPELPLQRLIELAAERLGRSPERRTLQIRLSDIDKTWHLVLDSDGAMTFPGLAAHPTLSVITDTATLRRIAAGSYSPISALAEAQLRISGDLTFGKHILRTLGGVSELINVYPILATDANYSAATQTLRLEGFCFTPGGSVRLIYDVGGYTYQQIVQADHGGHFTASQDGISCGPIPGHGDIGVLVDAVDETTGTDAPQQGYPTPCGT